jgi:hypothetical protein
MQIIWKKATSDSEGTVTVLHNDTGSEQWTGVIMTFRGQDLTTPWDVVYSEGSHHRALQNKASPNVDAFSEITTVTDDAWVLAFEFVTHNDITSNALPSGYTLLVRDTQFDPGNANHSNMMLHYKELASFGAETPGAAAYTSNNIVAESDQYTFAIRPGETEGISSIDPTEFDFDNADVDIIGTEFEAVIGTGAVYLSDADTLAGSVNEVDITNAVNTWSDTVVNLDFTSLSAGEVDDLHTLGPGQRYIILVTDSSVEYGSKVLTVHRPRGLVITTSTNITPGTVGSARLTLTGTRTGGRVEEAAAQNPSTTTTDCAADGNREEVLVFKRDTGGRADVKYAVRLTLAGTELDTYTKTLGITFAAGGDAEVALTGQAIATSLGSFVVTHDQALSGQEIATVQGVLFPSLSCPLVGQELAVEQGVIGVDHTNALAGLEVATEQGTIVPSIVTEVALTGQEIVTGLGSLGVDLQVPLAGQEIATEQGTIVAFEEATDELVGQEVVTAQGSLGVDLSVPLVGLEIVSAQGSFGVDLKVPLTGLEIATELGTLTPTQEEFAALTGLEIATAQGAFGVVHVNAFAGSETATEQGSLGVTHENALTGLEFPVEQGLLGIELGADLSGQEVAVEQGSVGVDITVPLVGLEMAASLGILSTDSKVGLSGQEVASALGGFGVDTKVAILGEEIATALGIMSPQVGNDVTLPITGQEITTALGTLGVINTAPGVAEGIDYHSDWRRRRRFEKQNRKVTVDHAGFSTRQINVTITRRR